MSEYHVSSLVVHAAANQVDSTIEAINALPHAEVSGVNRNTGKLVVVIEGPTHDALIDLFNKIDRLPGVMAALLVFHRFEEEMNE